MLFAVLYLALGTLAAACQPDGDHVATCQVNKCEMVDSTEICTQCKAGGVPIDGFCWPFSSPQVITAGCTKEDGADLDSTANTCGRCSGADHFLFMGGCYNQKVGIGGTICTAASGGECTACAKAGWLFENPSRTPDPSTKCILCSDVNGDGKAKGVENCAECTKPGTPIAATCSKCKPGYVKDSATNACKQCGDGCSECSAATPTQCTACFDGKYLKADKCVDASGCDGTTYADKYSGKCESCKVGTSGTNEIAGIGECEACTYNDTSGTLTCTNCGAKIPRVARDGTSKCVDKTLEGCKDADSGLFAKEDASKCILCSDVSAGIGTPNDNGIAGCKTCAKASLAQPPTCTECLEGYIENTDSGFTCDACGENCATCSEKADKTKCQTCKPGFFLVADAPNECVLCDDTTNGGSEGCSACSNSDVLKCAECKPNYKQSGTMSGSVTCTKVCEDETACGGTAGACNAIVVGADGKGMNYCSYCGGADDVPIDGRCVNKANANDNTECTAHKCPSCAAADYFLYMGGCYSTKKEPGNLICTEAKDGKCIAPTSRYFAVPDAAKTGQSVLACGNPLGTAVGDKTYVGVEGCSQCTAPAQLDAPGMAAATCTACGEGRKPNKSGTGCAACSVENCRHCRVDGVCEECSSGFSLEGGKCVSTSGPNLSTGAIAGISVAAVVVVGGLVGFLCWWFICRGKA